MLWLYVASYNSALETIYVCEFPDRRPGSQQLCSKGHTNGIREAKNLEAADVTSTNNYSSFWKHVSLPWMLENMKIVYTL
jgi:hypothetical protein